MKLADGTTSAVRSSVTRSSTYGPVGTNKAWDQRYDNLQPHSAVLESNVQRTYDGFGKLGQGP